MEEPLSKSQRKKLAAQKFNEEREVRLAEEAEWRKKREERRNRPLTPEERRDRHNARLLLAAVLGMTSGVI